MLTLSRSFARGDGRMKVLSVCVAALVCSGLVGGCQKREPTQPGKPTVAGAKVRPPSPQPQPHRDAGSAGFEVFVRKRHFDLP
jgi:hypothetical protein